MGAALLDMFVARYEYWMTTALLITGLYGLIAKGNLVKKLIGLNILQSAIIMFFVSLAIKPDGTLPILPHHGAPDPGTVYMSPLPHVLMLTAIVVMVSTSGVAFALAIRIFRHYGSLDESVLLGPPR